MLQEIKYQTQFVKKKKKGISISPRWKFILEKNVLAS